MISLVIPAALTFATYERVNVFCFIQFNRLINEKRFAFLPRSSSLCHFTLLYCCASEDDGNHRSHQHRMDYNGIYLLQVAIPISSFSFFLPPLSLITWSILFNWIQMHFNPTVSSFSVFSPTITLHLHIPVLLLHVAGRYSFNQQIDRHLRRKYGWIFLSSESKRRG